MGYLARTNPPNVPIIVVRRSTLVQAFICLAFREVKNTCTRVER
jgi:hypothetical protein